MLAGGRDGRLYLLDAKSLGGADHHTPLFASDRWPEEDRQDDGDGFRGTFSTGSTSRQDKMVLRAIIGPPDPSARLTPRATVSLDGSVVALKLAQQNGQPALQPVWLSRNMVSPAPVIIANEMVFALSTGESPLHAKQNVRLQPR